MAQFTENELSSAFAQSLPRPVQGVQFKRTITPLVVDLLRRRKSPLIIGLPGGREPAPEDMLGILPRFGELVLLLTADLEDLTKWFEDESTMIPPLAKFLDSTPMDQIVAMTGPIMEALQAFHKSTVTTPEGDDKYQPRMPGKSKSRPRNRRPGRG